MTFTATDLLRRCRAAGLTLRRDGDRISIKPARCCSPELLAAIRAAKPAILDLLEVEASPLPADCIPWVHIARQVLAGEFAGADGSTATSVMIGLRAVNHPLCRRALNQLKPVNRR